MLFNDAMAIQKEGRFKRKAIHDATRAELESRFEQQEMGDISCDDEEFERRMQADKKKQIAEYGNGDPEWTRRMNARVELKSHRRMERKDAQRTQPQQRQQRLHSPRAGLRGSS
jgi:hypothetical protein